LAEEVEEDEDGLVSLEELELLELRLCVDELEELDTEVLLEFEEDVELLEELTWLAVELEPVEDELLEEDESEEWLWLELLEELELVVAEAAVEDEDELEVTEGVELELELRVDDDPLDTEVKLLCEVVDCSNNEELDEDEDFDVELLKLDRLEELEEFELASVWVLELLLLWPESASTVTSSGYEV
jgi:hypothetical protein